MPSEVVYKPTQPIKKLSEGGDITSPKYTPSFYEWLKSQGEEIFISVNLISTSGNVTLYTIPEGYSLYLTGFSLTALKYTAGAFSNDGYVRFYGNSTQITAFILWYQVGQASVVSVSNSQDYSIPLKLLEKSTLYANITDASNACIGGFQGFLIKNSLIPII